MIFDAGAKLKTPSEIFPPFRIYADVPGMLVKEYVYVWLCFAQPLENQKRTYMAWSDLESVSDCNTYCKYLKVGSNFFPSYFENFFEATFLFESDFRIFSIPIELH